METAEDLMPRAALRRRVVELFAFAMRDYPYEVTPHTRAQIAIRNIVGILSELAYDYELSGDLKAALFDIGEGSEPYLPDDVRQLFERPPFGRKGHTPSDDIR